MLRWKGPAEVRKRTEFGVNREGRKNMYETSEHIVSVSSIIGIDFWWYLHHMRRWCSGAAATRAGGRSGGGRGTGGGRGGQSHLSVFFIYFENDFQSEFLRCNKAATKPLNTCFWNSVNAWPPTTPRVSGQRLKVHLKGQRRTSRCDGRCDDGFAWLRFVEAFIFIGGESRMRDICNVCLFSTLTLRVLDYIGITLGVWSVRTETMVRRRRMGTKMAMKNCKMPLLMILPMTGNRMSVFAKPAGWFILESNCCWTHWTMTALNNRYSLIHHMIAIS